MTHIHVSTCATKRCKYNIPAGSGWKHAACTYTGLPFCGIWRRKELLHVCVYINIYIYMHMCVYSTLGQVLECVNRQPQPWNYLSATLETYILSSAQVKWDHLPIWLCKGEPFKTLHVWHHVLAQTFLVLVMCMAQGADGFSRLNPKKVACIFVKVL